MLKETIVCIIIILAIIIGNVITQNYTTDTVIELTRNLEELKQETFKVKKSENMEGKEESQKSKEEKEIAEKMKDKINEIEKNWNERHEKLAYYIEHDELEKVETNITSIKSFLETEKYAEAINDIEQNMFILKHIKEKYAFSLENIF